MNTQKILDTGKRALIKEETANKKDSNTKEEKIQLKFLLILEPEPTHKITGSKNGTEMDHIIFETLINLCNRKLFSKNKYNSTKRFFEQNNQLRRDKNELERQRLI